MTIVYVIVRHRYALQVHVLTLRGTRREKFLMADGERARVSQIW